MASFKRKTFYVGGFDPRGVRFYYQLLKEQLGRFAAKTGRQVTISPRRNVLPIRSDWTIRDDTADVTTDYSFLRWEDIVQRAWIRRPWTLARRVAGTYWQHWRLIDFKTARKLGRGPLITLFYPPLLAVLLPLLIALPIVLLGSIWLPWWLVLIVALPIGVAIAAPVLTRFHVMWLLRFFVFNGDLSRPQGDALLAERLDGFADQIAASLDDAADEVLLVTHSNGAILGMSLMRRLLDRRGGAMPANFTLVTLGHSIPLVACRRDAGWFHDDLRAIAQHDFRWIDIGSPPDGTAYCGVNPLLLQTAAPVPQVELLSPRFHKFYDPETYHKGWRNKYEIHFDYLRVGDHLSPLDFPSLMTADRTIQQSVAAFRLIP